MAEVSASAGQGPRRCNMHFGDFHIAERLMVASVIRAYGNKGSNACFAERNVSSKVCWAHALQVYDPSAGGGRRTAGGENKATTAPIDARKKCFSTTVKTRMVAQLSLLTPAGRTCLKRLRSARPRVGYTRLKSTRYIATARK